LIEINTDNMSNGTVPLHSPPIQPESGDHRKESLCANVKVVKCRM